uniref:Uncharacterized protein n=1 Tax=Marseillevirus LCMAC101 TaxID=2506602 RepID=A0A481YRV0_9VIRU|nr:MAG: hypothetical protein LCMAC101_02950 [Marseillevirus LCMAC101]
MADNDLQLVIIIVGAIIVIGLIIMMSCNSNDKFKFDNSDYQYDPPPITVQNNYYKGIQNECGGNTYDYDCLEKVHLKAFRGDMDKIPGLWDAQTRVCMDSPNVVDERSFYRCLDGTYAGYQYP